VFIASSNCNNNNNDDNDHDDEWYNVTDYYYAEFNQSAFAHHEFRFYTVSHTEYWHVEYIHCGTYCVFARIQLVVVVVVVTHNNAITNSHKCIEFVGEFVDNSVIASDNYICTSDSRLIHTIQFTHVNDIGVFAGTNVRDGNIIIIIIIINEFAIIVRDSFSNECNIIDDDERRTCTDRRRRRCERTKQQHMDAYY